jgi:hypothetical protein
MDAIRISDNKLVMLKLISKLASPYEVDVGLFFSCPPLAADPRNHCVPVYDVLQLPKRKDVELIVMPLLRRHDDPTFDTVGEVVECFRQIFEVGSILFCVLAYFLCFFLLFASGLLTSVLIAFI